MSQHSIAEARDRLPELIERALAGEGVVITRAGEPVVELRPVPTVSVAARPMTDEDVAWLRAHRVARLSATEDAGELVGRMRDEDWA